MRRKVNKAEFPEKGFLYKVLRHKTGSPYLDTHTHLGITEFQYIISGKGAYLLDEKLYKLKTGSFLVIHRHELHRLASVESPKEFERITFQVSSKFLNEAGIENGEYTKSIINCSKNFPHLIQFSDPGIGEVEYLLKLIMNEDEKRKEYWKEAIGALLTRLFIVLSRQMKQGKPVLPENDLFTTGILQYIDKNISTELALPALAAEAGFSPTYLSAKFKKNVGMNITDYITSKRISEAKKRLEESPEEKVISVAFSVGFKDLSHFNHTFKKITGFTPSAFRKLS